MEAIQSLMAAAGRERSALRARLQRHTEGARLSLQIRGVHPPARARAVVVIEKFLGGGFAGQVYRCRIEALETAAPGVFPGLQAGQRCAMKIYKPPSPFARRFRDLIYRLAFQAPFGAQVNPSACRAGLLWQKIIRAAAAGTFGDAGCVKDVYASFYDPELRSYGEITEWVEGRMWRLESDPDFFRRCELPPEATASTEYVAKRLFMAALVKLLHDLGAPELARQYEWSTMKSQPNVLRRTDRGDDAAGHGLCAIDFRAGLALLPFLPMSPGDPKLIVQGLRRGAWVQFDRGDMEQLRSFMRAHPDCFRGLEGIREPLEQEERAYRRSQPDLTRHARGLLADPALRSDVRRGLIRGYSSAGLVDAAMARRLGAGGLRFALFYLLGALPLAGKFLRRIWGRRAFRRDIRRLFTEAGFARRVLRQRAAVTLLTWRSTHRVSARRAVHLLEHPGLFYLERWSLGWLPLPRLHRAVTDPRFAWRRILITLGGLWLFATRPDVRERWFLDQLADGERNGMLTAGECAEISARVREPFITKYLRCMAVHFATIPVTQLVGLLLGALAAAWMLAQGHGAGRAAAVFGGVLLFFQVFPISPGSICRGGYVVYLMIRERNVRDYRIAAPLSFVKYVGYLAFPLQMTARYPQLARFLAGRWAAAAVRYVPVFGEHGALLEHWTFDLFFNAPQALARWAAPRRRVLLGLWMLTGLLLGALGFRVRGWALWSGAGINALLAVLVLFVLPFLAWGRRRP